ncbi:MAG: hypothetical protein MZW92_43400 [Comamonadaceae bacterium]|nr:hypothetical protein [Comamonadaceae bacterium]
MLGACNPPFAHRALDGRADDRPAAAVQRRRARRTTPARCRSSSWTRT